MSNSLTGMLESIKLETISQVYSDFAIDAEKNNKSYIDYLSDLVSIEIEERRNKTIAKFCYHGVEKIEIESKTKLFYRRIGDFSRESILLERFSELDGGVLGERRRSSHSLSSNSTSFSNKAAVSFKSSN